VGDLPLQGRNALVTGGGSGIGLGTACRLAADGANVVICGRTEQTLATALQSLQAAAAPGAEVGFTVADVTVEDDVAAAVTAAARGGELHILFACAGGAHHLGPIADADASGVRATVELNLVGSFLCVKHAARVMPEGSAIVLMSSGAGRFPHRMLWAYGMSKAGIDALCMYAAEELADKGIRVNSVQPGIIDTDLMGFITAGGPLLDDYLAQIPLGRIGTVEDVAEVVRFLSGPESSWLTGENIAIDGGHHLRRGADYSLLGGA